MQNKDYSRRDMIKRTAFVLATPLAVACNGGRYIPSGGANQLGGTKRYDLVKKLGLGNVDEKDSRYVAKGLNLFDEECMKVNTFLGDAMFKKNKANIVNYFEVNEKGQISGKPSLEINNGLYFIRPGRDGSELLDWVELDGDYRKATMSEAEIIKKQGLLKIFQMSEKNAKFGIEYVNMPGGVTYTTEDESNPGKLKLVKSPREPFFAVKVSENAHDKDEVNFFNHYLIPVDKSRVSINPEGIITIKNKNRIFRPTFMSWNDMDSNIEKLDKDEQKDARKQLEALKDGSYFSKANKAGTNKKKE